jgi:hypothetical protein
MRILVLTLMMSFLSHGAFGVEDISELEVIAIELELNSETIKVIQERKIEEINLLKNHGYTLEEMDLTTAWLQRKTEQDTRSLSPISICDLQSQLNIQYQLDDNLEKAVKACDNPRVMKLIKDGARVLDLYERFKLYMLYRVDIRYADEHLCGVEMLSCIKSIFTRPFKKILTIVKRTPASIHPY